VTAGSGLRGYSLPLSPTGRSALVPAPPWHFSGEVVMVEYRADPCAVEAFLPRGLDGRGFDGLAAAIFGDWQSCTDAGAELADPVRSQYREFYVVLACSWQGTPVARCPMCWVDRDFSLVRGLIQGYPKKMGSIAITRGFRLGRATPPAGAGGRFSGTLAAGDRRLVDLHVTLETRAEPPPLMLAPLVHTRFFPAWDASVRPLEELVTGGSVDQAIDDVWTGPARLEMHECPSDELTALRPVEILRGYRFAFAETITGGTLLSREAR